MRSGPAYDFKHAIFDFDRSTNKSRAQAASLSTKLFSHPGLCHERMSGFQHSVSSGSQTPDASRTSADLVVLPRIQECIITWPPQPMFVFVDLLQMLSLWAYIIILFVCIISVIVKVGMCCERISLSNWQKCKLFTNGWSDFVQN